MAVSPEAARPAAKRGLAGRTRPWLPWLVGALGVALTLAVFGVLQVLDRRNAVLRAGDLASERTAVLVEAVHDRLSLVTSARLLFDVSDEVTRPSFSELHRSLAGNVPGLRALFFLRRVDQADRSTFEEYRRQELPSFAIRDRAPDGRFLAAADRDVYFPADFVEPSPSEFLGFDPWGDARCRAALERASDFDRLASLTSRGLLPADAASLFVASPVYETPRVPSDVAGRRRQLRGYVGLLAEIGPLIDATLSANRGLEAVDVFVFDSENQLLYSRVETGLPVPSPVTQEAVVRTGLLRSVDIVGTPLNVVLRPQPGESSVLGITRLAILSLSLTLTAFIVLYTRRLASSEERLEALVEERTRDLKLTSEQLQQAQKMEAVGRLTGGIAHDFNNLLTVVIGNVSLARESVSDERVQTAMLDPALQAAERGADLTQRLLSFSRRQRLRPTVVDLGVLVDNVRQLLRRTLGAAVALEVHHPDGLWPVLVDAGQLETALVNLALNARDAMPEGGTIIIEMENTTLSADPARVGPGVVPGAYVLLAVSDTGTGMTEEVRRQAFEPFFTTKAVGKGSGLGLSMVFGFVMQSNGHVTLASAPGRGTTVRMYFPRAAAAAGDR